jgi:hypothetical protein
MMSMRTLSTEQIVSALSRQLMEVSLLLAHFHFSKRRYLMGAQK